MICGFWFFCVTRLINAPLCMCLLKHRLLALSSSAVYERREGSYITRSFGLPVYLSSTTARRTRGSGAKEGRYCKAFCTASRRFVPECSVDEVTCVSGYKSVTRHMGIPACPGVRCPVSPRIDQNARLTCSAFGRGLCSRLVMRSRGSVKTWCP